jgi:predicted transcriptional regulator
MMGASAKDLLEQIASCSMWRQQQCKNKSFTVKSAVNHYVDQLGWRAGRQAAGCERTDAGRGEVHAYRVLI